MRPGEPGAPQTLLDAFVTAPAARVLRPGVLSGPAVARLVRGQLGDAADDGFVAACTDATGGNPLLVVELVRDLHREGRSGSPADAAAVPAAAPEAVTRAVAARLRRLTPDAVAIARSVAVLGERTELGVVAALAGLAPDTALAEHAVLARAGLFDADRLRFVHPLMQSAVLADLVGGERAEWHARAARALAADGAPEHVVAAHLLRTVATGDAWTSEILVAAGRRALSDGAPDVAVRLLRRAVAEPPPAAERAGALLALGLAEAAFGDEHGLAHLEEAAELGSPEVAGQAERARSIVLFFSVRAREGLEALERAAELLRREDGSLERDLEDDLLMARHYAGASLRGQLPALEAASADGRRAALAHLAIVRALTGAPAQLVVETARRALDDGELLRARVDHPAAYHAMQALMMSDAADESMRLIELAGAAAGRAGSRFAAGLVAGTRTFWEHEYGDLRRAEEEARIALDAFRATAGRGGADDGGVLALGGALLGQGRLDEAERLVAELPADWGPESRNVYLRSSTLRARLRLAQGRAEEALGELEAQVADERANGWAIAPRDPTRAALVEALAAVGRREEALAYAAEQIELDRRRGVATSLAGLCVARARALDGPDRIEAAREAVAVASGSPSRLARAQALTELGGSLRRAGHRADAREPLREARELAHRCGATSLEALAHEELIVAGGRPQRLALSGVEGLTAAERRVAELAARGLRNREIAETLFVSVKTVEVHLGRAYTKLEIGSRSQLAAALEAPAG
jgi:DNA-binding CsgD family transcriptional regulator